MQRGEEEGLSRWQKATISLTAASAVVIFTVGLLVLAQLDLMNATPGFVEFGVLAILLVGMLRKLDLAYFGVLIAKIAFVLLAAGALVLRPPAIIQLGWFGGALAVNILLGVGVIVSAAQSLREPEESERVE